MHRTVFALTVCVFGALPALAQDERPRVVQPVQPLPARPVPVTAAKMAQLEEEVEALDAHREVKKAHVKAAEIGVRAAEINLDRVSRAAASNAVAKEEVERAKVEVEMAKAQVEIRVAELKEIEVKVKYARKRLDDAKAGGVRPNPSAPKAVEPKPADPAPMRFGADEKDVAELKEKLAKTRATAEKAAVEVKKADEQLKVAEGDLAKLKDAATKGRVRAGAIEALEAKVAEAKEARAKATKAHKSLDEEVAALQQKLKEIEK